jgi:adenylate cyclase
MGTEFSFAPWLLPLEIEEVAELSASELVLRYYAFMQQVNLEEHAALRAGFERVLKCEPNHAIAWACLSNLYVLEYGDGFNPLEKPMERAQEAAWRAVKIDPACQMGWKLLSVVHFFSRDYAALHETAERAMALNPRDGTTLAYVGNHDGVLRRLGTRRGSGAESDGS